MRDTKQRYKLSSKDRSKVFVLCMTLWLLTSTSCSALLPRKEVVVAGHVLSDTRKPIEGVYVDFFEATAGPFYFPFFLKLTKIATVKTGEGGNFEARFETKESIQFGQRRCGFTDSDSGFSYWDIWKNPKRKVEIVGVNESCPPSRLNSSTASW